MYGWNESVTKAETRHLIGGDKPAAVYDIGLYQVTVSSVGTVENPPEVTYVHKYRHTTDPRQTLPNMEIADGEIRIPVTDLVGEMLKRLEPVDLARALFEDKEVRAEFMECMVHRYQSPEFSDSDRRDFLTKVQAAVHDAALDRLANRMSSLEFDTLRNINVYSEADRINTHLEHLGIKTTDGKPMRVMLHDHGARDDAGNILKGALEVGGTAWNEGRSFWREKVSECFPMPAETEAA